MTTQAYEDGFAHGANAALHHIALFVTRIGHDDIAERIKAAWADNTLVEQAPAAIAPTDPTVVGPARMSRDQAREQGFTGNQCSNCGSMRMKVSGHCEVCAECGTTTGCS